ncbi:hypothetical protein ACPCXD_00235 [Rhodococcus sp. AB351]|uniref:hypothetical protein n=1 Tax=Rhodococcus sp. AB351 TaxID=3413280 RepID=UPI003C159384
MKERLSEPDYQLVWPRTLFVAEASKLLNQRQYPDWDDRCLLLLTDAFVSDHAGGPVADFNEIRSQTASWDRQPTSATAMTDAQKFLKDLMTNADALYEDAPPRRPYWRDRRGSSRRGDNVRWSIQTVAREFVSLIRELDDACYFDRRFGVNCVDDDRGDHASIVIERELGEKDAWPLDADALAADVDLFYSIVEVLHDSIARPRKPSFYHQFGDCGWHREDFDIDTGRAIYRWRVNKIFDRGDTGLRLAEEGEDIGRLVTVTDVVRGDLVAAVANRSDEEPATEQVRHALALFRERGADRNQKRSAIAVLALILEERRHDVLTDALAKSDRGALFEIANGFHIRHQNAGQKRDYDDFYLDWVFWVYLASIELTNRILDEQQRP